MPGGLGGDFTFDATGVAAMDEPCRGARVLVVEDDPEMRSLMVELLAMRYRVSEAGNGREGFERAARELPDLILSDVIMPGWSGHDLVEALRSEPRTRTIPVILLSADADELRRGGGADDFIAKPFGVEVLFARVQELLDREHALRRRD